jgi:hypothetical protein
MTEDELLGMVIEHCCRLAILWHIPGHYRPVTRCQAAESIARFRARGELPGPRAASA